MVTVLGTGETEFRVFSPQAQRVEVCGSFTGWEDRPVEMERSGDGWWSVRVPIEGGDHEFQYRIDGRQWLADYAAHGVKRSGLGCWVSTLFVPAQGRRMAA